MASDHCSCVRGNSNTAGDPSKQAAHNVPVIRAGPEQPGSTHKACSQDVVHSACEWEAGVLLPVDAAGEHAVPVA
jgi:hypothetical protein